MDLRPWLSHAVPLALKTARRIVGTHKTPAVPLALIKHPSCRWHSTPPAVPLALNHLLNLILLQPNSSST